MSCFLLLLLRRDLGDLVLVEGLFVCSCVPVKIFSLNGSSGGASGHGVRFDGIVMSKGGSIIHLHKIIESYSQGYGHMDINVLIIVFRIHEFMNSLLMPHHKLQAQKSA